LGVVIQECLTGVLPYTGSSDVEVIAATLTQEPKIAADLPEPFLTIVRGCLTKDYRARWTATDVLQALQPAPAATHNTPQASVQSPSPANRQTPSGAQQEPGQSAGARPPEPVELRYRLQHVSGVTSVAFSPDGRRVLTGSWDATARLWDLQTGQQVRTFQGHTKGVLSVAFAPDGRLAVTGSRDRTARLWDIRSGQEIQRLIGHTDCVRSVAFSPNGKWVLTGSDDNTARLWSVETGQEIRRLVGHADWVLSVAFSPDSQWVLTGSRDQTARLWDTGTALEFRRFIGHTNWVQSVAFSPRGRWVATGNDDGTVRLWDVETGDSLCSLLSFRDGSWAVVDPENRYDAPHNGRIAHMYWAAGDQEIPLAAYRDHFYHPGLLARILGFSNEPLRPV